MALQTTSNRKNSLEVGTCIHLRLYTAINICISYIYLYIYICIKIIINICTYMCIYIYIHLITYERSNRHILEQCYSYKFGGMEINKPIMCTTHEPLESRLRWLCLKMGHTHCVYWGLVYFQPLDLVCHIFRQTTGVTERPRRFDTAARAGWKPHDHACIFYGISKE